jgi:cardiolipin synthase
LLISGAVLLICAAVAAVWPRLIAWPLAVLAAWIGTSLVMRYLNARRRRPPPERANGD